MLNEYATGNKNRGIIENKDKNRNEKNPAIFI
jgi:hypothetical protein